jgi:transposase
MSENKDLYAAILGVRLPWQVMEVDVDVKHESVTVTIASRPSTQHTCPTCGKPCPGYDTRRRSWRHLDTCQFKTVLVADVPRVKCDEHGVVQIATPWAEPGSSFTALMECLVIDWLQEASILGVARLMGLTWDQIDGVMRRAVRRGLERRKLEAFERLGVDETSARKGHRYVTVVTDMDTGNVVHVADDRTTESLDEFWVLLTPEQLRAIEVVAMDMCAGYIRSARKHVPGAESKVCFDRFHVAKILNDAVNSVRKQEIREAAQRGEYVPTGTKYVFAQNPENMPQHRRAQFELLKDSSLKVARAWAIKDAARWLWKYAHRGWAERMWSRWIGWAMRCRLEPMKKAAHTVRDHLWGIVNAVVLKATNASSESTSSRIQRIKKLACGFRNNQRFKAAIYFHLGGLDLYPRTSATHTTS